MDSQQIQLEFCPQTYQNTVPIHMKSLKNFSFKKHVDHPEMFRNIQKIVPLSV